MEVKASGKTISESEVEQISSARVYVPQVVPRAAKPSLSRRARAVWLALLVVALVLLASVLIAPLATARGNVTLATVIYKSFNAICHQMPERSFYLHSHPLAVCARCWGVYIGFAVGVVVYPLVRSLKRRDAPSRGWLFAAAVPVTLDFLLGVLGIWANTHTSRALTGALLGGASVFYVLPGLIDLAYSRRRGSAEHQLIGSTTSDLR